MVEEDPLFESDSSILNQSNIYKQIHINELFSTFSLQIPLFNVFNSNLFKLLIELNLKAAHDYLRACGDVSGFLLSAQ